MTPRCRHFGPCGGCTLQQMAYPDQVRFKIGLLAEILRKELGTRELPVPEVICDPDPWAYRSKMEFTFGEEAGRVILGLHERGSFHRIVDIEQCEIAAAPVSRLLAGIRRVARRFPARAWHPRRQEGFWRYAVVRSGAGGDLLLLLITYEGSREPMEALARELPADVPELKSVYWGVSTRVADVARPERLERLFGSEWVEDQVSGVRYRMGPGHFVQPNLHLVPQVYQAIRAQAGLTDRETVADLYCGIGLITLLLARDARAAVGVECEPENVAMAERNATINGLSNATFLCGKTEDLLKGQALFRMTAPPDCVVLDPPRAGLHKGVIPPLLQARPRTLLYLSCNPASQARDLRAILEREPAYRVEALQAFDFFPHTAHLELLATLRLG